MKTEKEYFVYVLKSLKDGRIYKGMTENVEKRLKQHNSGATISTKGYRPWMLIYKEKFDSREEARGREKYLKSGVGREFIKQWLSAGFKKSGTT